MITLPFIGALPGESITIGLCVIGYLLGSIPFGLILTRLAGFGDIRTIGSGNIGATNVLRTGKKSLAAATLILDALKGTAAVLIGNLVSPDAGMMAGACAFFGHLYPVWLGFKGGKGVATFFGIMLAVHWPSGLAGLALWLSVAVISRYSSLAALISAALTPLLLLLLYGQRPAFFAFLLFLLLVVRHRANIERLIAGTEPKIGASKQA